MAPKSGRLAAAGGCGPVRGGVPAAALATDRPWGCGARGVVHPSIWVISEASSLNSSSSTTQMSKSCWHGRGCRRWQAGARGG